MKEEPIGKVSSSWVELLQNLQQFNKRAPVPLKGKLISTTSTLSSLSGQIATGTQFRIWASQVLKDHILKGFNV